MRFRDNTHDKTLNRVAYLTGLKYEKKGEHGYYYYNLIHKSGVYFYIQLTDKKQFHIVLNWPRNDILGKNYSTYLGNYMNKEEKEKYPLSINVSVNKSPDQITADLDRRLFESFQFAIERYEREVKKATENQNRLEANRKKFKKFGFSFYDHNDTNASIYDDEKYSIKLQLNEYSNEVNLGIHYIPADLGVKLMDTINAYYKKGKQNG